jgi:hypothetical protein
MWSTRQNVAEGGGITPSFPSLVMVYVDPEDVYRALPEDTIVMKSSKRVLEDSGNADVPGDGGITPALAVEKDAIVLSEIVALIAPLVRGVPVGGTRPSELVDT